MKSPIRVLLVDDSAFIRYTVTKHLEMDPDIEVVGSARDGLEALTQIPKLAPDVVVLDVEMPHMDGLTALKRIMVECPIPVVMLSALTQRGARTTIQPLMRGALDVVPKPDAALNIHTVIEDLSAKIKTAAGARSTTWRLSTSKLETRVSTKRGPRPLRKGDTVVVIGTSTGGPRALHTILSKLPADL
ncbi:MAG: response regulator, partial [bacterium]|nr:response regulator [bacterium]